ncbi:MAG: DUF4476 domain-containing protein [Pseudomonadota bacterium]
MNRLGILTILCLFALTLAAPAAAQHHPHEKGMVPATPGPKEESRRLLQKSMQRLGEVQKILQQRGKLEQKAREEVAQELKDIALDLKTVQINLRELTVGSGVLLPTGPQIVVIEAPPEPVLPLEPAGPMPMEPASFRALLAEVDGQSFSDDKLLVVRSASREAFFMTAQVKAMLDAFVHSSDKIELLRVVADRIVDRENIFTIYGSLVHSSDKEEAREILEGR